MTRRRSIRRGLPDHFLPGNSGAISAHFASGRLLCTLKVVPAILRAGDSSLSHLDLIRFSQTYES